jgi:hypothetical protein
MVPAPLVGGEDFFSGDLGEQRVARFAGQDKWSAAFLRQEIAGQMLHTDVQKL